jgi:hypothetical protein
VITISMDIEGTQEDLDNIDRFCRIRGYQDFVNGDPNPQSKTDYITQELEKVFTDEVKRTMIEEYAKTISVSVATKISSIKG